MKATKKILLLIDNLPSLSVTHNRRTTTLTLRKTVGIRNNVSFRYGAHEDELYVYKVGIMRSTDFSPHKMHSASENQR
jgi:hypothetical protein